MATTLASPKRPVRFEDDARHALERVRAAFAALLESLPERVGRPHEVSKVLGVHRKLGWQIANLVYEPDAITAAQHIPGPASIRRFLAAAAEHNVSADLIHSAEAAVGEFDKLIEVHAGDRESLSLMLAGAGAVVGGEAARKADLAKRKSAFNAGSYIWGAQAQTLLMSVFLSPSAQRPGFFDLANLSGIMQLRRMRLSAAWPIRYGQRATDDGTAIAQPVREPLEEAEGDGDRPPLLRKFCSRPIPEIRRRLFPDGGFVDELVPGPVGKTGAIDCFFGEKSVAITRAYRTEHSRIWGVTRAVRLPCEVLVLDQYIHKDLFGPIQPELHIYRDLVLGPLQAVPLRHEDRLPTFDHVQRLGEGLAGIRTPDVPRYVKMVSYVFERLGWDPDQFDVYRARVEYPPVPTTVSMEHDLPEAPGVE